jgi:hypothetical protein
MTKIAEITAIPKLKKSMESVLGDIKVAIPTCIVVSVIKATALTLTASKNGLVQDDLRRVSIKEFNIATNKNEGRKIPTVATIAPGKPAII